MTTRWTFKVGDVFPADDPVAVFIVAVSIALNDLLRTNKRMVGGNDAAPAQVEVEEDEQLYLLRLDIAQFHELCETIKNARNQFPDVETFISSLPAETQADLAQIEQVNPPNDAWVEAAIRYVRNQTFHYGGRWDWEALEWSLTTLRDEPSELEVANQTFGGLHLRFADLVTLQYLIRKIPEHSIANSDPPIEVVTERLGSLAQAVAAGTTAAIRFVEAALAIYFSQLPSDAYTLETDDD